MDRIDHGLVHEVRVIDPGCAAPLRIAVLSAFAQAPETRAPTGPRPSTAEDLATRAGAGDTEALRALLVVVGPHVLRTVRRIVPVAADAEDAAQDAMTAFVRDFASLRESKAVIAFATVSYTHLTLPTILRV